MLGEPLRRDDVLPVPHLRALEHEGAETSLSRPAFPGASGCGEAPRLRRVVLGGLAVERYRLCGTPLELEDTNTGGRYMADLQSDFSKGLVTLDGKSSEDYAAEARCLAAVRSVREGGSAEARLGALMLQGAEVGHTGDVIAARRLAQHDATFDCMLRTAGLEDGPSASPAGGARGSSAALLLTVTAPAALGGPGSGLGQYHDVLIEDGASGRREGGIFSFSASDDEELSSSASAEAEYTNIINSIDPREGQTWPAASGEAADNLRSGATPGPAGAPPSVRVASAAAPGIPTPIRSVR